MNVIYFGYRDWSYRILTTLVSHRADWRITALATSGTPEFRTSSLPVPVVTVPLPRTEPEFYRSLFRKFDATIALFYGWSWMIPPSIVGEYECLILHTSPLPKYRGGSPLQHQIINGETESAISIFRADRGLDTGPVYGQVVFPLDGSLSDIFDRIVTAGSHATINILDGISAGTLTPTPQDESQATLYQRRTPEESEITINDLQTKTALELYNFIRALGDPYPNAFIRTRDGKKLLIRSARLP